MSFTSTKEIYEHLIKGFTLLDSYKNTVSLDYKGNQLVRNCEDKKIDVSFRFDNPTEWDIYRESINISVVRFKEICNKNLSYSDEDVVEGLLMALRCEGVIK